MELKELAQQLEKMINEKMNEFFSYSKKAIEIGIKIAKLEEEREKQHRKMADVLLELEPVESIIRAQNPNLNASFDTLKKNYHAQEVPVEIVDSAAIDETIELLGK